MRAGSAATVAALVQALVQLVQHSSPGATSCNCLTALAKTRLYARCRRPAGGVVQSPSEPSTDREANSPACAADCSTGPNDLGLSSWSRQPAGPTAVQAALASPGALPVLCSQAHHSRCALQAAQRPRLAIGVKAAAALSWSENLHRRQLVSLAVLTATNGVLQAQELPLPARQHRR